MNNFGFKLFFFFFLINVLSCSSIRHRNNENREKLIEGLLQAKDSEINEEAVILKTLLEKLLTNHRNSKTPHHPKYYLRPTYEEVDG